VPVYKLGMKALKPAMSTVRMAGGWGLRHAWLGTLKPRLQEVSLRAPEPWIHVHVPRAWHGVCLQLLPSPLTAGCPAHSRHTDVGWGRKLGELSLVPQPLPPLPSALPWAQQSLEDHRV
jgi:hypothetical protein